MYYHQATKLGHQYIHTRTHTLAHINAFFFPPFVFMELIHTFSIPTRVEGASQFDGPFAFHRSPDHATETKSGGTTCQSAPITGQSNQWTNVPYKGEEESPLPAVCVCVCVCGRGFFFLMDNLIVQCRFGQGVWASVATGTINNSPTRTLAPWNPYAGSSAEWRAALNAVGYVRYNTNYIKPYHLIILYKTQIQFSYSITDIVIKKLKIRNPKLFLAIAHTASDDLIGADKNHNKSHTHHTHRNTH